MKTILLTYLALFSALSTYASFNSETEGLLRGYLSPLDAKVGVCVLNDEGAISINALDSFPMLSVMKFPLALTVADKLRRDNLSLEQIVPVISEQLHTDTYSPMLSRYPAGEDYGISVWKLLDYSLRYSDNNACDILIDYVGGVPEIKNWLHDKGYSGIDVNWTEDEMHSDIVRCYQNTSTPFEMARLFRDFLNDSGDSISMQIKRIIENCDTGKDRLPRMIPEDRAVIGHKTGTGDRDPQTNRIIAVNDAGYVMLPDGRSYAIAVFVTDSGYSLERTEDIISHVSEIVWNSFTAPKRNM